MQTDFIIIGGGIAGASIGYHLAADTSVTLVEMEDQPGYHTTGRSAAFYAESYGGPAIRPLTSASKEFLLTPPDDFMDRPVLTRCGALHFFERPERETAINTVIQARENGLPLRLVSRAEAISLQPLLAKTDFDGAFMDADCGDLDVAGLHHAYLKGFKARGGTLLARCRLLSAKRHGDSWQVETTEGQIEAKTIINTAGAWADTVAKLCGVRPLGLTPFRRTVITAEVIGAATTAREPLTLSFNETLYFKQESGRYLISPEDETLSAPCDCQPELADIAMTIYRFESVTGQSLSRPNRTWAGLRTFAPDRAPVIGYDKHQPGFFWNVGQGGYGIQTCPAWSQAAATLALGQDLPERLKAFGCDAQDYDPARFG